MGPSPGIPDDPGGLLWKGELGGGNGGGQNPNFNPPYGGSPPPGGTFGGGGSGGFFVAPGYGNFTGYDAMSAGVRRPGAMSTSAAPAGYSAPGASSYAGGGGGGGGGSTGNPWMDAWNQVQSGGADIGANNRFIEGLIGGQGAGTAWDPNGNPAVLKAMQDYLTGLGGQQEQSAVLGAGLDNPNADMYSVSRARGLARQDAMNNTANALASFRAQLAGQHQDLINNLLSSLFGSNLGVQRQNNQYSWQNALAQGNKPNIWDQFFGGAGKAAGGGLDAALAGLFA